METDILIQELNLLWEPIRALLARQIEELYGHRDGHILEIGPFSGLIFALAQKSVGQTFSIAAFPQATIPLFQQEVRKLGLEDLVKIIESDSSLINIRTAALILRSSGVPSFSPPSFGLTLGPFTGP